MECPTCGKDGVEHGYCIYCKKYCGCSFNTESLNDYCSFHRPFQGLVAKRKAILDKIKPVVDNWLRHNPEAKTNDEVQLYESFSRFFMLLEAHEAKKGR